jgi:hypothetical protein
LFSFFIFGFLIMATELFPQEWFGEHTLATYHQNDTFRFPEGRIFLGATVLTDSQQEAALKTLPTEHYNAYLMARGCVIAKSHRGEANRAFQETFGNGKMPLYLRSAVPVDLYVPRRLVVPLVDTVLPSVPPSGSLVNLAEGYRYFRPHDVLDDDEPFRHPEGRTSSEGDLTFDTDQEDAREQLSTPVYNAYLMHRGCFIDDDGSAEANQAYMDTYVAGAPPQFNHSLGPSGMMAPPP